MQDRSTGRHLADTRQPSSGGRVKHFMRLGKVRRETFHASHAAAGPTRLQQFLRIARGRMA